ncbi:hypothetical protein D3875_02975 [Deinococcus cavernae]|uniref:MarR family transcriptional regulator n=1 Tax=Deinococcus cavernae TaxID=2320857 RepID=A0A418VFR6_9DEIO|nr:hypothetical protein D3875_02975 [Deinococcus cavernae]
MFGALKALGHEGRQAHIRARLLTTLFVHATPMAVKELADGMGMAFYDVARVARALMAEGLTYPCQDTLVPTLALTRAPHVRQECDRAAELLGLVLTDPRTPLSPLLGRPA